MIIYPQEEKDGLKEIISSKASLTFDCDIKVSNNDFSIASIDDPDLFYIESTYTTVGWNSNDDVFDRFEMWRSRKTPANKKFNFMHNENDIIGHITEARVIDKAGLIIDDDTKEEDLPDFFEIAVSSVIYRKWMNAKAQERINKLLSEIVDNKWFVSMEVLFPDFAYAVTKDGVEQIIERNNTTAFLTKHLRAYGGSGEYDGYKLGRVLRNMTFSGKGLVDRPGNKRSLITLVGFNGAKASENIFKEVNMSVEQKDYDKAVSDLAVAKQSLEATQAKVLGLESQLSSVAKELEASKALSEDKSKKIQELEDNLGKSTAKLSEVNQSLASVLDQIKTKDRVNQLINVGVELAKAEKLVEKFASASDEMFVEVVALNKKEPKEENAEASAKDQVDNASKALDKTEVANDSKDVNNVLNSSASLLEQAKKQGAHNFLSDHFKNKKTK
jgi:hypothetical protein